ncbi:TetR family transcriptional regulator C-terminal domain-containing protein [Paenibacillus sp. y28]|uniref:TetR family transcriptional regulator C-terminal domain-containing protein n=1 Tax=Paenibacillus sp. y28 TaxID=3129110 RepID=UPI003FA7CA02
MQVRRGCRAWIYSRAGGHTAVELGSRDPEAIGKTLNGFTKTEQQLAELIQQGQQSGEFAAGLHPEQIAESLHNSLVGLRVMARTPPRKESCGASLKQQ